MSKSYIGHDDAGRIILKKDQRMYERIDVKRIVSFKVPGKKEVLLAETVDVSQGGAKVRINKKSSSSSNFDFNTYIMLRIEVSRHGTTAVCAVGRIRYSHITNQNIIIGVQFIANITGGQDYAADWKNIDDLYSLVEKNKKQYEELIDAGFHPWEIMKIKLCSICRQKSKVTDTVCDSCGEPFK